MPKNELKDEETHRTTEELIPKTIARFGSSLFLKGELSGDEDLVIEGHFKGKINLGNNNILIGEGGKVEADIQAKNITINGNVRGNIYASGRVLISKVGQLKGDIHSSTISIMDGARFKGSVKMGQEDEKTSPPDEITGNLPFKMEGSKETRGKVSKEKEKSSLKNQDK